ncbi:acyltransferase family protein [Kitasatospora purpeofusca]|uniref:acyltransferase family protein n=1 Tax=Kitasatospora purpeofusca TaxID=67352 RepID=UPI002257F03C|nr:acyltransferase [Kitasatospora purpeofusca]MCX4753843.1 acyltransferase [Kitasatospora purpeofusca]WSR33316.1 acyltransferase [Kitasatospora purpeofusca]WSR41387.1 acyltransferase [Kitasatospora purpeofusca]
MATDRLLAQPGPRPAGGSGARTTQPSASRLPSLTGLRFPAALAVFAYHAALPIPTLRFFADDSTEFRFVDLADQAGGLGVAFFFVLSGFVLTWSARPGDTATGFWRRRMVKIVPNYVVAWALAMIFFAGSYTPVRTAVLNLLMLQVWIPDFNTYFSVDPPSWSLGAELVFYLSFPLLHRALRRIRPERLLHWIGGAVAAIVATPALAYLVLPDTPGVPGGYESSVVQYWFSYVLPPVRLLDFALGILVALAVRSGRWRDIGMVWSGLLLVAGYVATRWVPYLYAQRVTTVVPIALLVASAAIADRDGRFTPFRNRAMTWLGEISFAFYLLHFIVLTEMRDLLGTKLYSTPEGIGLLLLAIGVTVLLSWILYRLVEAPITKRFSSPRRKPAGPAPTS